MTAQVGKYGFHFPKSGNFRSISVTHFVEVGETECHGGSDRNGPHLPALHLVLIEVFVRDVG